MKRCKHNYDANVCSVCSLHKPKTLEDLTKELHEIERQAEERRIMAYRLKNKDVPEAIARKLALREETLSGFQIGIMIFLISAAVTAFIGLVIKFFGLGIGAMVLGVIVAVYAYFENN